MSTEAPNRLLSFRSLSTMETGVRVLTLILFPTKFLLIETSVPPLACLSVWCKTTSLCQAT